MKDKQIVGYEIHTLDNMMGRLLCSLMEKNSLTKMQGWIIGYLYEHSGETIFQKDLEAQFRIAPSTATGILKLMEKHGLLRRESVSTDARLKRLVLTETGISYQLRVLEHLNQTEALLKQHITKEQLDIFFQVIRQMKRNIEENTRLPKNISPEASRENITCSTQCGATAERRIEHD